MNQDHPVNFTVEKQERYSRKLALATLLLGIPKAILLIPHFIVVYLLSIVAFALVVIAQVIVLFTARYPEGIHEFVVAIMQWQIRVNAYFVGLTDRYPPFRLK